MLPGSRYNPARADTAVAFINCLRHTKGEWYGQAFELIDWQEQIVRDLIQTPGGKAQWRSNVVLSILQNEKHAGNALLQKGYTIDFLTKARRQNFGEIPQYFVENSHPAIIEPVFFELVQHELQRRAPATPPPPHGRPKSTLNEANAAGSRPTSPTSCKS